MRTFALIGAICSALIITGCGAGTETVTDKSSKDGTITQTKPAVSSIAGKYKGEIELPKKEETKDAKADTTKDLGKDLGEAMAEGLTDVFTSIISMELEITPDDKFTLSMMGIPVTGSLTRAGDQITLTPEKVMGMTKEEFEKQQAAQGKKVGEQDMSPMKGTVRPDGSIVLEDNKGKAGEGSMVFKKATEKPVGAATVASGEKGLVGEYKAKIDPAKLKPEEKQMAEAMMGSISLKLSADNTFSMKMMMDIEGKWSVQGDRVILKADKAAGFTTTDGKDPEMKIEKDGSLTPIGSDGPPFTFVKK